MRIPAHELQRIVRDILIAETTHASEASLVARHLVESNLTGHDSHGVSRLPRYVDDIRRGAINVNADVHVERDNAGVIVIHGDWCFGQVAATRCFDLLMDRARAQGVAAAGVHHCNDTARLGAYTHAVAKKGFFALMMVNDGGSEPLIAPWGGTKALFSSNPLSAAAPGPNGPAFCVDISTCVCAGGAVKLAEMRGQPLPPGTIMDHEGRASTNPADLSAEPRGSILPLGAPVAGHKGFGLNLIIDVLCGAIAGAGCSGTGDRDAQGIFALVIDVEAFTDRDTFLQHLKGLIEAIRTSPKQEGVPEIRIPGEHAEVLRSRHLRDGIDVDGPVWKDIRQLAMERNVDCGG